MPEPPHIKSERFIEEYGIAEEYSKVITSELALADAFEEVAKKIDPSFAALWMRDELKRVLNYNKMGFAESGITTANIVELLKLIQDKKVTPKAAKKIIEKMPKNLDSPAKIAEKLGLIGVSDKESVLKAVKQAIDENPQAVSDYHEGKKGAMNFLIGQVMRLTRGKADPGETAKFLSEALK
ncbi:MAG TPA: Asp-tRNA(Asn)/Glu-tRNA(Gln) amidotransferase GatCAB subunit B, partial [Methanobacterium sp.]|nr:Asp-tRNA(Asn)/Glu-tRNA(Gln) amidotransferase GatCAB subunit B [Methanobacterium sp.]